MAPTCAAPFWSRRRTDAGSNGSRARRRRYGAVAARAADWGGELIDADHAGGLDATSGHGPWPEGPMRLAAFIKGIERRATN